VQVVAAHKPLRRVAHGLDVGFHGKPTAELFAVMICCPLLMNMIQVRWVCSCLPSKLIADTSFVSMQFHILHL